MHAGRHCVHAPGLAGLGPVVIQTLSNELPIGNDNRGRRLHRRRRRRRRRHRPDPPHGRARARGGAGPGRRRPAHAACAARRTSPWCGTCSARSPRRCSCPTAVVEDMRLAVTEACTNVVRHAYARRRARARRGRRSAPRASCSASSCPTDGRGIGPEPGHLGPGPRPAADRRDRRRARDRARARARAAALAMSFSCGHAAGSRVTTAAERRAPTSVSIAAGPLVGPVLRRVVGHARRARRPAARPARRRRARRRPDRRARPAHVRTRRVDVALEPGPRTLSLRVGPLRPGGGEALVVDAAVPGVGNVIEQLADELRVAPRATRRVPARPTGLRGRDRRDPGLESPGGITARRMAIEFEIEDRRSTTTRTSSRSPARSTCSRPRSSSSASRPRSTPAARTWSST